MQGTKMCYISCMEILRTYLHYKIHVIDQFDENYVTIILQAPYEVSWASGTYCWFDFDVSNTDTVFNENHLIESLENILFCIDEIVKKEKIGPARIFIGDLAKVELRHVN